MLSIEPQTTNTTEYIRDKESHALIRNNRVAYDMFVKSREQTRRIMALEKHMQLMAKEIRQLKEKITNIGNQ